MDIKDVEKVNNPQNIVMNVIGKTIGGDLVSVKPTMSGKISTIPPEPEHPANEHWELVYPLTKDPYWKKLKYDHEFEDWDAPKIPFDISMLTDADIKALQKTKHLTPDGQIHDDLTYYFRGPDHLHMVTSESTWKHLCGRHWVYDKKTHKTKTIIMS